MDLQIAKAILNKAGYKEDPIADSYYHPTKLSAVIPASLLFSDPSRALTLAGFDWGYEKQLVLAASIYAPKDIFKDIDASNYKLWKGECNHVWKKYAGLNETFEYCATCDVKRKSR